MNKTYKYISLVLLIILPLLSFLFLNYSTKVNKDKEIYPPLIDYYSKNFDASNEMNGLIINDTIYDTVFSLSSGKFPVFILRYTDRYCNQCYENLLKLLKLSFDSTANIIILNSHRSNRDFKIFKKENKIVYKNILVQYNVFDWEIEKYETPYFFIINSNKTINNIFIPDINYPHQTQKYFTGIKRILNNKNIND